MSTQRADTLLELGRHQEALAVLADLGDEGLTAHAHCLRARAYLGLKRYKDAEQAAAAARAAAPGWEWGYRLGAIAARSRGRPKDAWELATHAARLAPNDANPHQVATLTALDLGDGTAALHHAETLVRLAPHDAMAHRTYARVLIAHGAVPDAEAPLRQALALDPQDDEAMSLLADVVGQRDKKLANELRVSALRTAPHNAAHRRNVMKRGGLAAGGTVFAAGKIGVGGKIALLFLARPVVQAAPVIGAVLLGLYPVAFAWTRVRRHRHGKTLPPLVWEGLKADRRNADLRWLAVPCAIALAVGTPVLLGQLVSGHRPWAAVVAVPGALGLVAAWRLRLGEARQVRFRHAVGETLRISRFSWDYQRARLARTAADRSTWVRGTSPTLDERWKRAFAMCVIALPVGGLLAVPLGPAFFVLGWLVAAAVLGALLDRYDRPRPVGVGRVVRYGTLDKASRPRLALRAALRLPLLPILVVQLLFRSSRPMRLLHDRLTGTEYISLVPNYSGAADA